MKQKRDKKGRVLHSSSKSQRKPLRPMWATLSMKKKRGGRLRINKIRGSKNLGSVHGERGKQGDPNGRGRMSADWSTGGGAKKGKKFNNRALKGNV